MIDSFVHDVPACRVVFGAGSLDQVESEVARLGGERVMLVAGGPEAALAQPLERMLDGKIVARFADVTMHVPVDVASAAEVLARANDVDLLLSFGGGSATGTAKAVALGTGLPILAVPTTYAGSEMTSIWGLTEGQRKTTGRDPRVLPKTVVYDPELTVGLPADLSAASGMNAMAHLVEALYDPAVSPVSFLQAEEGVRALASALPRVVADPGDLSARGEALYGAWLAGWALGTTGMGVHHKICHVLGGAYNLPHAPMHSAVLSHATAFNEDHAPRAMEAIRRALGSAGIDAPSAAAGIYNLETIIGAPTALAEVGMNREDLDEAARLVVEARPTNPRPVDMDGVRALLLAAYEGTLPRVAAV